MTSNYRLIAFDLPGSGESSDASDPERTYTLQGSADAAIELLGKLGVTNAIVFGWAEPFMCEAVARADGRFRKTLMAKVGATPGPTQRQIVESSPTPIAVVKGGAEPIVNVDHVETVRYANLWQKTLPSSGWARARALLGGSRRVQPPA